jgi:hypothetical protein
MSRILPLLFLAAPLAHIQAADAPLIAALAAADDARIGALLNPSESALLAIFSDDLRYGHANGVIETKGSFVESLTHGKIRYLAYENEERNFTFPAPQIALMTGRSRVKVRSGAAENDVTLLYLGVWRLESGQWRFLAWQSSRVAPASGR